MKHHECRASIELRESSRMHQRRNAQDKTDPGDFERLGAVSDQLSTEVTSTTAMNEMNYCRNCLDQAHTNSKLPHISNGETYICANSHNFHNRSRGCPSERLTESPSMLMREQRLFRNRRFSQSICSYGRCLDGWTRLSEPLYRMQAMVSF